MRGRHAVLEGRKITPFLLRSGIQLALQQKADQQEKSRQMFSMEAFYDATSLSG